MANNVEVKKYKLWIEVILIFDYLESKEKDSWVFWTVRGGHD